MRSSESRFRLDINHTQDPSFINYCRNTNYNHFTRNRKMPLNDLLLSMFNRKGLTLVMELRKFFKTIKKDICISKVGYLKQRMKLNPKAFLNLSDFHTRNFYKDAGYLKRGKGYLLFSADGTALNIPTTEETLKVYGTCSSKLVKPQAAIGLSCLYDVMNKMIIDCTINRCKFNEKKQAEVHLNKSPDIIGEEKFILLLDRGYSSMEFFVNRLENEQKFIARLKSSDFKKEQKSMVSNDDDLEIVFNKARLAPHNGTALKEKLEKIHAITLRFVKVKLSSGVDECLATNLSREAFSEEEISILYSMRWKIETAFDILKNKLELENFTGIKPIILEQDIYSCVYLCNLIQDIILDAEEEQNAKIEGKYKHQMSINRSLAIGILKDDLIQFVLTKSSAKKTYLFEKILEEIEKHLVPIRPGRHFRRTKGQLAGNFSNTHKRSY